MKIAHPSCSQDSIQQISDELALEADILYAALEKLELKQGFLAATTIFNILKNDFAEREYTFTIDYTYDDSGDIVFRSLKINDGLKDIKDNRCSKISLNLSHFMENIEDKFMTPSTQNIKLFNDEAGINNFLSQIMGEDYLLWQHMNLEQQLPDKNLHQKKPKI